MSDEKRQQIINGLQYCSDGKSICGESCPAYNKDGGCRDKLMKDAAVELIKALQRDATQITGYCPICEARAQQEQQEPEPLTIFQLNYMIGKPVFSRFDGEWHIVALIASTSELRIQVGFTDGETAEGTEETLMLYATEPKGEAAK